MKEMESLYERFEKLRDELKEKNPDEIGAFELRSYRRRFESIHRENLELQTSSRRSDMNNEELIQVLNLGDRLWESIGETLKQVIEVIDIKMALGKQYVEERKNIQAIKDENLKLLKRLRTQYNNFKKSVESIADPTLKSTLEDKLKMDEETINKLQELDASYENRMNELRDKIKVVALGGKLPELETVRSDTDGLEDEESKKKSDEMVKEGEEVISDVEIDPVTAIDPITEKEPTEEEIPVLTDEGGEPVPPLEEGEETRRPTEEEPIPPLEEGEETRRPTEEEPIPPLEEGEETRRPTEEEPIPPLEEGEETRRPTEEEPIPPLEEGEETRRPTEEEPIPPLEEGEETRRPTEEEPIPPLEEGEGTDTPTEDEVEETPVRARVKEPKSSIWGKITNVIAAIQAFLIAAIAAHTGIMAHKMNQGNKVDTKLDTETVEETDVPEETEVPTETPAPTKTPAPTETPTETPAPVETASPSETPIPAEEPTITPTISPTVAPTEAPTVNNDNIVLAPGESAYDTTTGVEVGYTGTAALENENGTVSQEDRDLEQGTGNTVVVGNEDFQPDPTETPLPRTGQEISEEEARDGMTEGEENNLNDAIDGVDWDSVFNGLSNETPKR